ncbi:hypothetical protein ABT093_03905 [Kitasatospora sp. NPDC002551]|uniref:hypothetical protein n=1 Tax=Kitasatospora sp. NPDC002551 TaxID=3154539 RepID=UPI00332E3AF1
MRIRHVLAATAIGAALTVGAAAAPAVAATPPVATPSSAALYWVNSGETFNRFDPCNQRGAWYWDNYSNVYSWDCRWSGSTYKLWLQKG